LTGAGVSTPSGLPDFRSPGTGLWEHQDPLEIASLLTFRHDPEQFYARIRPLAQAFLRAEPNAAHLALANLEAAGRLFGVITQNIDGLHQRAGSVNVLEVHGSLRQATCIECYVVYPTAPYADAYARTGIPPRCPACGGFLKPNAILMGEQLPWDTIQKAILWSRSCDLILVAGSSLEITPAGQLPLVALRAGARCIIVNRQPTYLDERADVVLRQDVAVALPRLAQEVMHE